MGNEIATKLPGFQDSVFKVMDINGLDQAGEKKKWDGHKDPTGQPSLPIIITKQGKEAKLFKIFH